MYKISDELAREILKKIKNPEVISTGNQAFTFAKKNSVGIIDTVCAFGTDFDYSLECPIPIIYPEITQFAATIKSYFLYKREELMAPIEPWEINRALIDPMTPNPEEKMDVADCAIILASDIEKLTCRTITTIDQLIKYEPAILDCLDLSKK